MDDAHQAMLTKMRILEGCHTAMELKKTFFGGCR